MEKKGLIGFNPDSLSEESKTALQSETWSKVREAISEANVQAEEAPGERREVKHFTTEHTPDNAYGLVNEDIVREYLILGYKASEAICEIEAHGNTYKILKRPEVTVFYDANGDTLFDVENDRLEREYKRLYEPYSGPASNATAEVLPDKGVEISDNNSETVAPAQKEEITELEKTDPEEDIETSNAKTEKTQETESSQKDKKGPKYSSGGEKIKAEAEAEYKAKKGKEAKAMMKGQMTPIVQYLTEKCEADPEYNALVIQEHKTWKKCYDFMMKKARAMAAKGSNGLLVEGETILEWIDEYYQKDDKEEAEAEKKLKEKATEKKKKQADKPAQNAKEKQEALGKWLVEKSKTKPEEKKKENQEPEKPESNVDEQIDMFSVFNV
ncbi:PcfK-like family protein [Clostridiales Family XIII bacterium ASD5510]|uniref:PcfK-like family protein n=1 Tax=Hominibacterium faecale TaxID=2839743 RepID=A0A9J6QYB2_9FIRM|nr:Cas9 inhibitor AcrIIA9 family protein [Hominibacterium faecale]MCU7380481.1 PcfK-like family protein [Hominibacterium faecale]